MISKSKHEGIYVISVRNTDTGKVTEEVIHNRIMDDILDEMAGVFLGNSTDLEIAYCAVGTGNTAITDADTQLDTEIFRTPPSSASVLSDTGEITTEFIILDSEAVAQIEEIAIFVGSTATSSANTGKLLSRILWSKNKLANEEITIKRVEKVVRG